MATNSLNTTSQLLNSPKPSITVGEARKLLGKNSCDLSDTQVNDIISTLQCMAKDYLYNYGSKKVGGI